MIDHNERLLGMLTPAELLALPEITELSQLARRDRVHVQPATDQEKMASIALHHGVAALPVVDETGRLVGVVDPTRLMNILRREHIENLHRLAGITHDSDLAREAFKEPPMLRVRHRLPWLVVGLGGSMIAALPRH